jgi:transcriptional regulator with XRE-family HTH domain
LIYWAQLAAELGMAEDHLSEIELGTAKADLALYRKLAQRLDLLLDDIAPDED